VCITTILCFGLARTNAMGGYAAILIMLDL
jgi:hypothetical protein